MNKKTKYLYLRLFDLVHRYVIVKEDEDFITIRKDKFNLEKISKKTYQKGKGYPVAYFCRETSALKEEFEKVLLKYQFKDKLKSLETCTDENIIKKIMEIENKE